MDYVWKIVVSILSFVVTVCIPVAIALWKKHNDKIEDEETKENANKLADGVGELLTDIVGGLIEKIETETGITTLSIEQKKEVVADAETEADNTISNETILALKEKYGDNYREIITLKIWDALREDIKEG